VTVDLVPEGAAGDARTAAAVTARPSVLDEIAHRRRRDIERELAGRSMAALRHEASAAPPPRDLAVALCAPGLHLIAELKRRSPSAGPLAEAGTTLTDRARAYELGGAAAISVLVEPHRFGGSIADLVAVRAVTSVPLLAKEFVVDPRQLPLLRAAGADAVLLLAALHPARRLRELVRQARDLGIEPLVEVHDRRELQRALATDARIIGLNNRDLRTLMVDLTAAEALRPEVPDDRLVVAESGVTHPVTLARWRALGVDGGLVGEALMRHGGAIDALAATVATFVAAGREPTDDGDPAAADRRPTVKICGVTDAAGLHAAIAAGADEIGLNLVPGTRRALDAAEAGELARLARSLSRGRAPRIVGVVADRDPADLDALASRIGLDAVQLSGRESPEDVSRIGRPVRKVLHLPAADPPRAVTTTPTDATPATDAAKATDTTPATDGMSTGTLPARSSDGAVIATSDTGAREVLVGASVRLGRAYLVLPSVRGLLLDTADAAVAGGTGRRASVVTAAAIAAQLPVVLAGGLDAGNVAAALRSIPAIGVDVASGVEPRESMGHRSRAVGRPTKDPLRSALFVKRARGARLDRPTVASRPQPVHPGLLDADERGRWGTERQFGGRFVPETLVAALIELEEEYASLRDDPGFWAELRSLGRDYIGRPTPLYRADRLAADVERTLGRERAGLRIYLKREDLAHTGAHKINNAIGQALLARRLGKPRVIAETGAGQHGVATATACSLLGLGCVVYMGAEDMRRQAPNVLRMRALGAEVRSVTSGSATLKDAINEAMRDWVTNVAGTHYVLGSAVGPHPYPTIVRDLQRVIGDEAAAQLRAAEGRLPDAAVACVGGGSNAIGLFARFIGEPSVRLIGVEAAGHGLGSGKHAAALAGGSPGVLHGSRSYLLQDGDGQVLEAHSISAGLDYPGIGPQLSALYAAGRMEVLAATDSEALAGLRLLARTEGILPALEPAHAIAVLGRLLAGEASGVPLPEDAVLLLGLSGRGDKDLGALDGDDPGSTTRTG
jgi:tryptophan synthase beta chain